MKKFTIFFFLIFYSIVFNNNLFSQWARTNAGVEGGIIFSVYAVPSTNTVYCGSNGSGVFKSTNAGENWYPVNNGIADYGLYPTTFAATTGGVFMGANYSSTNGGGMYRTTDEGSTWVKINSGLAGKSLMINMAINVNNNVVIGTDSGLFRSTNNGNNWVNISSNMGSTINVQSLYYSNDTLIAGTESGMYFSTGAFSNWTAINTGLPVKAPHTIARYNNKIYIVYFSGGLYVSDNNGASWSAANYNLAASLNSRWLYVFNNTLFLSSNGGVYALGNNTWTNMNSGLPTDFAYFYCLTSVPGKMLTCTYSRAMYATTNNGASWQQKISGLTASSMQGNKILNIDNVLFAASSVNGVYKSTDGGINWITVNNGNNLRCNNIYYSGNKLYALTDNGVFSTTNSGETWVSQSAGLSGNDLKVRCMFADGAVSYIGTYNGVWKSTDNSQSWSQTSFYAAQSYINSIAKVNGVIMVGSEGVSNSLVRLNDGGASWQQIRFYQSFNPQVFDIFVEGNTMFIGTGHGVHSSTNTGANWTMLNNGLGLDPYVSCIIRVDQNLLYCTQTAGGNGIYRSSNNGAVWEEVTGDGPFWTDFRSVISYNGKLFISMGIGIYSRNESNLTNVGNPVSNIIPKEFNLKQNYPNPFNPATTIKFSVPKNQFVKINIYDASGKMVRELLNEYKTAGEYDVIFNAGNLSSGVYFYELQSESFSETKKMLMVK